MDLLSELDNVYRNTKCKLDLERIFSCVVCLAPKFKMVYGLCQHRICTRCGYDSNRALKCAFRRCPTCQQEDVFPLVQPNIPEDNMTAQKLCGMRVCKYKECGQEVWSWEKEDHELFCSYRNCTPKYHGRRQSVQDKYSPITPKSSSRRRGKREKVSDSDSADARRYLLRSRERSKEEASPPLEAQKSQSGYNLRNSNRSVRT